MQIKLVSEKEFEALPAQDVQDKLGMYYPETDEIYVRDTGVPIMDVFTAIHEMQHASGETLGEHYDPINKCYYKKSNAFFQVALPLAAGLFAPMLLPGLGAAGAGLGIGHSLGGAAASGAAFS